MRVPRPLLFAGAAALVAGLGVAATAEQPKVHEMKVALPDGSTQLVRYTGDAPPRVVMVADPFAGMPGFAELDRILAEMDAQMAAVMQHADAMQRAALAAAPAAPAMQMTSGAPQNGQFSYVSTTTVNGKTCTTSVRSVAGQGGARPQMLRQVSGDGCSAAQVKQQGLIPASAAAAPAAALAPEPVAAPRAPVPPVPPRAPTVPRDTI